MSDGWREEWWSEREIKSDGERERGGEREVRERKQEGRSDGGYRNVENQKFHWRFLFIKVLNMKL